MYIPRLLEEEVKKSLHNRKVLFILGARQVGKTTLIDHILSGSRGAMLNMDIEVDRARLLSAAKLEPGEAVRGLGGREVLVIDEAQRVPDIGRICKGWYDAKVPAKIILLGSASATLLDTAASELAGRNEKLWLTPLLFKEIISQQRWFSDSLAPETLHQDFAGQLRPLLLERLIYGSYPESYLTDDPRQYLTNISHDYLLKDIFTASVVRSPEDVRRLLLELARDIGRTTSVAQLATRLKLSRQTVRRYLDLLEGIFVIFSLPAFYTDHLKEITKSHKYYFWDTGVKNALQREWVASDSRSDIDSLWENWVIAEIKKQSRTFMRHEDMYFWCSRNGSTVDLVVKRGSQLHPFDTRFDSHGARSSRVFEETYGVKPRTVHRGNALEFLL